MKAADQVWVAAALLQRERGKDAPLPVHDVIERAVDEGWGGVKRSTLATHASKHCVASKVPNPGRYRMLTPMSYGQVRLYQPGDRYHEDREGSKTIPMAEDLPSRYHELLKWYETEYAAAGANRDPLMELVAVMRESGVWKGVDADAYVRELREDWD